MDYIQYLRSMVGRKPVIMVTAGVVILNANNELLLQRRADGSGWGPIGGFMELGESVEETARREVFEETGLTVGQLELFGVFSTPKIQTFANGDQVQVVTVFYLTDAVTGTLQPNIESLELRYFNLASLPEQLFAPTLPMLEAIKNRFGKFRV